MQIRKEKLLTDSKLKKIEDFFFGEINFHSFLNHTKRKFYIQIFKFNDEFEECSKSEYPCTSDAIKAGFNKQKKSDTTAVLLNLNLSETPANIYTYGEPADIALFKYQDRPMIWYESYKYGNTQTHCIQRKTYRNCGLNEYKADEIEHYCAN